MVNRLTQLNQCFQVTNQFVSARTNQYRGLAEVSQDLAKIAPLFNARQLSVQIFSQFPLLSEGLKNFFNDHQGLHQFYNSKIADLPVNTTVTPSNKPPALILKGNSLVGQPEARYKLSATQNILIGRDLQNQNSAKLMHIPLPMYKKVSGRHAEIQMVVSQDSTASSWQICDLSSTNGTYINGQKIKGCQVLKSGDKVTLAYSAASEKAPEFVFEGQITSPIPDTTYLTLANANLVFLIIHPTQGLSTPEKRLIEQVGKASIFGFVIVADISGTKLQDSQPIKANLSSIQSWIQMQYPHLASSLEVAQLPLYPFYPNTPSSPLTPEIERQLSEFAAPFVDLAKNQGAELLASRISQQLQLQVQRIEQILTSQEKALNDEIQRTEASLNRHTLEYWRDHYGQVKRQIEEAREDFFREARTQFFRARDEFATDFIHDNLLQRIDTFVSRLEPGVTRLNGQVCIQLQSSNGQDLHAAMISFCQAELTQWADQQWKKICYIIDAHGLEGLFKQSYNQLNCLPEFQLTNTFSLPSIQPSFAHHFNTSFSEVKADISYSESSGDAFGGIAKIAMLTASTAISAAMMSPYAVIQGVTAMTALGSFVGGSLSRPEQERLKLVQVVDSLRRNTCAHYRNIARYLLLNRVAPEIGSAIDAEDRRFRKARDTADEQIRRYFIEFENISRGYRVRQETLYKDRVAFEQIKRLGG